MRNWHRLALVLAIAVALGLPEAAPAAQLTVGSGSALDVGTATVDLGCADVSILGTLDLASGNVDLARDVAIQPGGTLVGSTGTLQVAGNWTNTGTFSAASSTVRLTDGCAVASATITGNSTFSTLSLESATAKTFAFASGSTQTVTTDLQVQGAPSNLLQIRATTGGSEAFLDLQGAQFVDYVDVQDNHAIGTPIGYPNNSTSSGNSDGWFQIGAVPALPLLALLVLAATLAWRARGLLAPRGVA